MRRERFRFYFKTLYERDVVFQAIPKSNGEYIVIWREDETGNFEYTYYRDDEVEQAISRGSWEVVE